MYGGVNDEKYYKLMYDPSRKYEFREILIEATKKA
jgi:hypothetical protein